MKTKSHLIIGSNSFLGHVLSKKLDDLGEHVLGVYHKNTANLYKNTEHISVDELSILENEYDVVYIVSAFIPNLKSKNIEKQLQKVNVDLVKNICKQFSKAKIVFCSSVSVYKTSNLEITETSLLKPVSLYGKSKLKGELIVLKHKKYSIVRISSMYGKKMKAETFLPLVIKNAIKAKQIILFGNGKRQQNYIHVSDVANYLLASARSNINGTFLATGENSFSNIQVANIIKDYMPKIKINFEGLDDSKSYLYNNTFTNEILGVKPNKNFKKEISKVIEWSKKQY